MLPCAPRFITSWFQPVAWLALGIAIPLCRGADLQPDRIVLPGPGASQQLVASGHGCELKSSDASVVSIDGVRRMAVAGKPGEAEIQAKCGDETARIRVKVRNQATIQMEPRFSPDVISILTIKGCNGSGCHGSPAGQNGFKLSLFGYDVESDHEMIVRKHNGRRIDLENPEQSLLLRKPLFETPHGGGRLLTRDSEEYKTLLLWLRQGAKLESGGPRLLKLEMYPSEAILDGEGAMQPVSVIGRLSDGTTRDMTRAVRYVTSDDSVARMDSGPVVRAGGRGLATILARGMGQVAAMRVGVKDAIFDCRRARARPAQFHRRTGGCSTAVDEREAGATQFGFRVLAAGLSGYDRAPADAGGNTGIRKGSESRRTDRCAAGAAGIRGFLDRQVRRLVSQQSVEFAGPLHGSL